MRPACWLEDGPGRTQVGVLGSTRTSTRRAAGKRKAARPATQKALSPAPRQLRAVPDTEVRGNGSTASGSARQGVCAGGVDCGWPLWNRQGTRRQACPWPGCSLGTKGLGRSRAWYRFGHALRWLCGLGSPGCLITQGRSEWSSATITMRIARRERNNLKKYYRERGPRPFPSWLARVR